MEQGVKQERARKKKVKAVEELYHPDYCVLNDDVLLEIFRWACKQSQGFVVNIMLVCHKWASLALTQPVLMEPLRNPPEAFDLSFRALALDTDVQGVWAVGVLQNRLFRVERNSEGWCLQLFSLPPAERGKPSPQPLAKKKKPKRMDSSSSPSQKRRPTARPDKKSVKTCKPLSLSNGGESLVKSVVTVPISSVDAAGATKFCVLPWNEEQTLFILQSCHRHNLYLHKICFNKDLSAVKDSSSAKLGWIWPDKLHGDIGPTLCLSESNRTLHVWETLQGGRKGRVIAFDIDSGDELARSDKFPSGVMYTVDVLGAHGPLDRDQELFVASVRERFEVFPAYNNGRTVPDRMVEITLHRLDRNLRCERETRLFKGRMVFNSASMHAGSRVFPLPSVNVLLLFIPCQECTTFRVKLVDIQTGEPLLDKIVRHQYPILLASNFCVGYDGSIFFVLLVQDKAVLFELRKKPLQGTASCDVQISQRKLKPGKSKKADIPVSKKKLKSSAGPPTLKKRSSEWEILQGNQWLPNIRRPDKDMNPSVQLFDWTGRLLAALNNKGLYHIRRNRRCYLVPQPAFDEDWRPLPWESVAVLPQKHRLVKPYRFLDGHVFLGELRLLPRIGTKDEDGASEEEKKRLRKELCVT